MFISKLRLNEGVYLIALGTNDKISEHIKKYNYVAGSKYNHIGILSITGNNSIVYDVHPKKIKFNNRVFKQTLNEFIDFSSQLNYIGIWKVNWISTREIKNLINLKENITYDYKFENTMDSTLYCSEFVVKVLEKCKPKVFDWIVLKKETKSPEKHILNIDTLNYYPVDFFIKNDNIVLVGEWIKNN